MYLNYVTAIDRNYLPGLYALSESIKRNAPECKLTCLVFGHEGLISQVQSIGIDVIPNPHMDVEIPVCGRWPTPIMATWSKFLIPKLFSENCLWVDADTIVLKKSKLIDFDEPIGATNTHQYTLEGAVGGLTENKDKPALQAGLLYFNIKKWNELEITERCFEAMKLPYLYRFVDQSVLSYVLLGNFYQLPDDWHRLANRKDYTEEEIRKIHVFHYNGCNPWQTKMRNQHIWNEYARPEDRIK